MFDSHIVMFDSHIHTCGEGKAHLEAHILHCR